MNSLFHDCPVIVSSCCIVDLNILFLWIAWTTRQLEQPSARLQLPAHTSFHPTGMLKWRIFCSITKYSPITISWAREILTIKQFLQPSRKGKPYTNPPHCISRLGDTRMMLTFSAHKKHEQVNIPDSCCGLTEMWFLNAPGSERCYGKCVYLAPPSLSHKINHYFCWYQINSFYDCCSGSVH